MTAPSDDTKSQTYRKLRGASVTRRQLTFALSFFLAIPFSVASPIVTRFLLSWTEAGQYFAGGGTVSIKTWMLGAYDIAILFVATLTLILGVRACRILAGLIHDLSYGSPEDVD